MRVLRLRWGFSREGRQNTKHPVHRNTPSLVDVVLIHGLLGNVFVTWRQRDESSSAPLGIFSVQPQGAYEKFHRPISRPVIPPTLLDDITNEYMEMMEHLRSEMWKQVGADMEFVFSDCPVAATPGSMGPFSCPGSDSSVQRMVKGDDSYTQCWPQDWLASDVKGLRVLGVNYETSLSHWLPHCPQTDPSKRKLEDRSEQILDQLLKCGVGDRPIVFIAHSMGGLLVKNMLSLAWHRQYANDKYSKFLNQTKAVMFFSTPHKGAHLATLNEAYRFLLLPSMEVDELRLNSPQLLKLHEDFLRVVRYTNLKVISFAETQGTMFSSLKINIELVPTPLADPNVGELYEIPLDHMNVCKPDSNQSFIYQKVLHCVQEVLRDATK
ncbi:protein SERAC1 [Diaphorina citri]|uniref:Protein SERAC1 n=1 Tax=Diaphorina citri TaxID=121845 RepID=A0A3Q0INP5_DIACI|nr:protein SERAC1 [Diaphorina citri]